MWSGRLHRKMNYIFREAVIRSGVFGLRRGKSGHHRAGFPAKAGGTRIKASSRLVPQKTYRLLREARVKRWGKSPPPQEQSSGQCKPNPMQDEIGDRAARPMIPGTSRLASARTKVHLGRWMNDESSSRAGWTESGLQLPGILFNWLNSPLKHPCWGIMENGRETK